MTGLKTELRVELLDESYLQKLLSIENQVHIAPWSRQKFQACFNLRFYQTIGLFLADELIGYAVMLVNPPQAELQNFAIAKNYQHQGCGNAFLLSMIDHCRNMLIKTLHLEVRESNAVAINLYQACGFKRVGLRKNYYQNKDKKENALLYSLEL